MDIIASLGDSDLNHVAASNALESTSKAIDPDLVYAMEVDREVGFKEERTRWRTSDEGVTVAREHVKQLFAEISCLAKKSNEVLKSIYLGEFQSEENEFTLCGRGLCLLIVWYCPLANTLDESRLTVEIYDGKFDSSTGSAVRMNKDIKYQVEYNIEMYSSLEIGWLRKDSDRRLLPTGDLARSCLSSLLGSIRREGDSR
jgi:hypothetical protein